MGIIEAMNSEQLEEAKAPVWCSEAGELGRRGPAHVTEAKWGGEVQRGSTRG